MRSGVGALSGPTLTSADQIFIALRFVAVALRIASVSATVIVRAAIVAMLTGIGIGVIDPAGFSALIVTIFTA